jgi:hypothetical protein
MLSPITDNVWVEPRPLRFFGVETGTKMTVVRLENGDVFVHSPVAIDPQLREQIDAIGPVRALVAPTLFHHLYIGDWMKVYPEATVSCCPGLEKKRKDLTWTRVLGDDPAEEWKGELEQVFFGARTMENEVIFFHKKSKTIISSDFMFNLSKHPSGFTRFVAFILGNRKPGATLLEHVMIRDRVAARDQVARVVSWGAERIVLAHGENVESNGSDLVKDAYSWL